MNTSRNEMTFGLVNEIPKDSPSGWGARAIQKGSCLDIVWDRQDVFAVDEAHHNVLSLLLNRAGMFEHIQGKYAELYNSGKLQGNQAGTEVLFEDHALVVVANTNGSYGYVYLAAYLKPSDDVSELAGKDHPEFADWESKTIKRWTYKRLPAIGEGIVAAVNNIGKVTVLRYAAFNGWLSLIVLPSNPPEWYRKQNAR
jgi:hypothetical protein